MAKVSPILTNFTAGEWSPRLYGRVDLDKYANACRTLENFIIMPHGGVTKRPGTFFVCPTKNNGAVRLIPFNFSSEQSYIIEAGDRYMRFYMNGGQIQVAGAPYEIGTPYITSELFQIKFAQSADILYLAHPNHPPMMLERRGNTSWTLSEIAFRSSADMTIGYCMNNGAGLIRIRINTGYDIAIYNITNNAGAVRIYTGPEGGGAGQQHGYSTNDKIYIFGCTTYPELNGEWTVTVDDGWCFTLQGSSWTHSSGASGSVVAVGLGHNLKDGDNVTVSGVQGTTEANGTWAVRAVDAFNIDLIGSVYRNAYSIGGTLYQPGPFTWSKVTSIDPLSGGVQVTCPSHGFKSGQTVAVTGIATDPSVNGSWRITVIDSGIFTLDGSVYTASCVNEGKVSNMYPACVAFFQQRLFWAGTHDEPESIWGSVTSDYYNLKTGPKDDDGLKFILVAEKLNKIRWMVSQDYLLVGTAGAEWRVGGSAKDAAITSSNVQAKRQSTYGSKDVQGLLINDCVLFLQRSGRRIREMAYNWQKDSYVSPDMALLAEHITLGGITQMAYQEEPDSILWCTRADGVLLGFTYLRAESVTGWHRHILGGTNAAVESVETIDQPDGEDQIWISVARTIGGRTVRYMEYFAPRTFDGLSDVHYVDSGLTYEGAPATVISGLDHLIGETVAILADSALIPNQVVDASGRITLPTPASKVHVGLPYTSVLEPVRLEAGSQDGTSQAKTKRIHQLWIRFMDTVSAKAGPSPENLVELPFGDGGPLTLRNGDFPVDFPGDYENEGNIVVVCDAPGPCSVLALMPRMRTYDGV